jgi:transposase
MIGCDLHDKDMILKLAKGKEKPESLHFQNNRSGRKKLLSELKKRSRACGSARVIFAYEASSQGFGLYDELTEAGHVCHVLAPTRMPSSTKQRKNKTDEKDAEKVLGILRGHVLAGNDLPSVWVPDKETRDDRELLRARLDVTEKITRIKTQIRHLLKRRGIRKPKQIKTAWSSEYGKWLWQLAKSETAMKPGARALLWTLLKQLAFLEGEKTFLDDAIETLSCSKRYFRLVQELSKIDGVGTLTAMIFLTEMGTMERFSNRRQIGSYLGLVPSARESGEGADRKGHITRQGPWRIRRALCQAAWVHIRCDKGAKAFYDRLVARNPKHKKIAAVAVMRRLAIRMWHVGRDVEVQEGGGAEILREARAAQLRRAV